MAVTSPRHIWNWECSIYSLIAIKIYLRKAGLSVVAVTVVLTQICVTLSEGALNMVVQSNLIKELHQCGCKFALTPWTIVTNR